MGVGGGFAATTSFPRLAQNSGDENVDREGGEASSPY